METIRATRGENGSLTPVGESYRILGIDEYPGVGRVLTRTSGAFSTFRYNVSRIAGEDVKGESITFKLEPLSPSVQEEIFKRCYSPPQ